MIHVTCQKCSNTPPKKWSQIEFQGQAFSKVHVLQTWRYWRAAVQWWCDQVPWLNLLRASTQLAHFVHLETMLEAMNQKPTAYISLLLVFFGDPALPSPSPLQVFSMSSLSLGVVLPFPTFIYIYIQYFVTAMWHVKPKLHVTFMRSALVHRYNLI